MNIPPASTPPRYNAENASGNIGKRIDMTGILSPEEQTFLDQNQGDEEIRRAMFNLALMRYAKRESGEEVPLMTPASLMDLREHIVGDPIALRGLARMAALMEQGKLRLAPPDWIARQARRDSGIDTRA